MSESTEGRSAALRWNIQQQHGLTTIALSGEFDLAAVDAFDLVCEETIKDTPVLVLDMEALEFMDSTGLRVLGRLHKKAEGIGCRLLLGRVSSPVRRVLHVSGLVDFFEYVEGAPPPDKICPSCDNWVSGDAVTCTHCGQTL